MTASAIYDGTIRHRRYADRDNEFEHGIALAYVDLDELPTLLGGRLTRRRSRRSPTTSTASRTSAAPIASSA